MEYIYAIKDVTDNKILNVKCGNGGKFYTKKGMANKRLMDIQNGNYISYGINKNHEFKIVTFKLIEIEDKI